MASHDYAKRKPKKRPKKPAVSRWVMILTLVVSMAFVGTLVMLSQQPDDAEVSTKVGTKDGTKASTSAAEKTTPPSPASPTKAIKIAPKNTAKPAAQKDTFDFYTLLPDSEVIPVPVEAYISTPKDPQKKTNILLQAGSFRKQVDANRLRAKLILLNLDNVVAEKTVSNSGSVWFRVRIGPFSSRSTLNKAEDILAQQGIESIRVKKSAN